jgi:hypothetical protein
MISLIIQDQDFSVEVARLVDQPRWCLPGVSNRGAPEITRGRSQGSEAR